MFKNIFECSTLGYRKIFKIFGIKISLKNIKKYKNKYISLGINCYPRMALTTFSVKPRKKDGELTFPFDLSTIKIDSIVPILENDFNDYYDDLIYDENNANKKWSNKKYCINYLHDNHIRTKEEFIKRYNKRIENFRQILKTKDNLVFITCLMHDCYLDASVLNNIYDSLLKYTKGKKFNYLVFNIYENSKNLLINKELLNNQIIYEEIQAPKNHSKNWWKEIYKKTDSFMQPYNQIYKILKENELV